MEAMKANYCHARSNSLPSRSHPLKVDVEDQLGRLRSSEATFSSPSILCQNLAGLRELYERFGNLLQLPLTQQALSNQRSEQCMENMLDGSLRLLDLCSTSGDVLSQIKASAQDLESSLRRRNGCIENEITKYFISKKQANKVFSKCFDSMKKMQKCNSTVTDSDNEFEDMAGMLKQVEAVSVSVFESLCSYVCPSKSKATGWSLVSKLIQSKRVSCEREEREDKIDEVLEALIRKKSSKGIDVMLVQKALKDLESTIQEIEEDLDRVFRSSIKTRVSLLNILNH